MTQREFAQQLRISETHLSEVLRDKKGISLRLAAAIEAATAGAFIPRDFV